MTGRTLTAILILLLAALLAAAPVRVCAQASGPPAASRPAAWRFVTGGQITFKPAADHRGILYVPSADRHLYALSPEGRERWRAPLGGRPSTAAVVMYDGTILVGTRSGRLVALGPSGRERWSFRTRAGACLTPALGRDGSVYLAAAEGTLHCLSHVGRELWRFRAGVELEAPPSVGPDGTVYLPASDRRLLALSPEGAKRWELALPGRVSSPAVDRDGCLYVGASGIHRVDPDGTLLWSYPIPARTSAPVLTASGAVAAGSWSGRLYALTPEGRRLWELRLPAPVAHDLASAGDALYVATASIRLYGVHGDGRLGWSFAAKQGVGAPAVCRDGSLCVGAEDWILYGLGVPAARPASGAWPVAHHDYQNTGRAGALEDLDNAAALILKTLAASESQELKLMALEDIASYLRGERYLGVHAQTLEEVLSLLSSEGVTIRTLERGRLVGRYPAVREASCPVLAQLGTEGARVQLLSVLRSDPELSVRIAAVQALGSLGLDPDGELAGELARIPPRSGEAGLLLAGTETLGRILLSGNRAVHPECFLTLAKLRGPEYPAPVRERAARLLDEIGRKRR
ncbi:MAG: PQQ-binding-like beta-propeller repeat protein [Spirochaetales bacterium]|nr:PQQ-binding-like beta-propeller repeat protein [Spirochaetales bacterium]